MTRQEQLRLHFFQLNLYVISVPTGFFVLCEDLEYVRKNMFLIYQRNKSQLYDFRSALMVKVNMSLLFVLCNTIFSAMNYILFQFVRYICYLEAALSKTQIFLCSGNKCHQDPYHHVQNQMLNGSDSILQEKRNLFFKSYVLTRRNIDDNS